MVLSENWQFFEGFEITQNWQFFDSDVFQIPGTNQFFDSNLLKYPEPTSFFILIYWNTQNRPVFLFWFFEIPRTGVSLKNQRTAPHWFVHDMNIRQSEADRKVQNQDISFEDGDTVWRLCSL